MTPRERVLAALYKEPLDKVPFTIYENMIPRCTIERHLRNEGLCIVSGRIPAYLTKTPNCVINTYIYTENDRQRIRTNICTPVGEIYKVEEPAGFTNWTIERLFKGPGDYKVLMYMTQDEHYLPNYEEFTQAEKWMGDDVILRAGVGLSPLHQIMVDWMGIETFSIEWMEHRDEILKLEKAMRNKKREIYSILADGPITHANYGGNEVPEVMGLERYKEFCIPLFNECAEIFHKKGKLLGTHNDGNNKLWADALAASSLDYLEAFTPAPDTDMTLAEALQAWPDKVLWINFPSSMHLSSIENIKRTTREIIQVASGANRLIIGITEDIPQDRWQENLLAISSVINNGYLKNRPFIYF